MTSRSPRRSARARAGVVAGLALVAALLPASAGIAGPPPPDPPVADDAVASDHRLSPLVDTSPGVYVVTVAGPRLSRGASSTEQAAQRAAQTRVLQAIGTPHVLYRYTTALNGFAARLRSDQVELLRSRRDVVSVERDTTAHLDGVARRPQQLARAAEQAVRPTGRHARASDPGSGVVIGFLDSGIWPANPAFDGPAAQPGIVAQQFPGFSGTCQPGEAWPGSTCTTKIVGARWFASAFRAAHAAGVATGDYLSARDWSGHGSLSASVAAGNPGITMAVDGRQVGQTAGVAPGAGIAAYKVCWTAPDPDDDGCRTADVIRGIDQATRDGVDVLSYPASGPVWEGRSAVSDALRGAASAGVSVTTSAGNTGPEDGTVHADGPWTVTVAAGGGQRFAGVVRLGDGTTVSGAMLSSNDVGPVRLVDAREASATGVSPFQASRCAPQSLAGDRVAGAIVVCRRGGVARVEKSATVARAGGVGMILVNTRAEETDSDQHAVPTVHVSARAGRQVLAYLRDAADPVAELTSRAADPTSRGRVPLFSSRGPTIDGRVLKPDLAAPGLNVPGAASPSTNQGRMWTVGTGTSVSTAYVTGAAARVRQAHPDWSAAAVRSALMTSARPSSTRNLFATGSGDLAVSTADDPGLVLDTSVRSWDDHAAGSRGDVNQASVSIPTLMGRTSVVRTFTNVSSRTETYTPSLQGLHDIEVATRPRSFTVAPGETARVRLVVEAAQGARYDRWAGGYLTWQGSRGHTVQMPIAARPVLARLPQEAVASQDRVRIVGTAGVTGALRLIGGRLVAPTSHTTLLGRGGTSTARSTYAVTPGTSVARFSAQAPTGTSLDLSVYRDGELVAASLDQASPAVTLRRPLSGSYEVVTEVATGTARTPVTTSGWVLAPATPRAAHLSLQRHRLTVDGGAPFVVIGRVTDRDPGTTGPLLGAVRLGDTEEMTLVSVE